ncbi:MULTISPECIES: alpha/beta hydrolase [Acidithrix]|uniref:Monoterpene epsilon-lactone hydrolase n=1 Tax=Acidithrix ferrooxidans TaxID=1280514 RepID=A0A0D8HE19_9ACTN|nr:MULTISPECIES: alpha/beta hydrolase [Acidithrix]KJF16205.1 monoterpene epsilon-lactone hydrolase [Acidithrix ferrooxidans]CAG4906035.1 unnamed protein product [Acidithrix sp. C25]
MDTSFRAHVARQVLLIKKQQNRKRPLDLTKLPKRPKGESALRKAVISRILEIETETRYYGGVECEWVVPKKRHSEMVLYYLHGGAYIGGSPATHRYFISQITKRAQCSAVVIDYRLAPENTFPAAVIDAVKSYRGLLESGVEARNIVLGGDSAGGGLALALVQELKKLGLALPRRIFLLSPWTDLTGSGSSVMTNSKIDPWLNSDGISLTAKLYLGENDPSHPLASPLFGNLDDCSETIIFVGSDEILFDDSLRLYDNLARIGIRCKLIIGEHLWHVWPLFPIPEAKATWNAIASFLNFGLST